MLIGIINFRNPKKQFSMRVKAYNLKELLYDYWIAKRNVVIICKTCGQLLAPCVAIIGPLSAGWERKKGGWICHQCHHGWIGFDKIKEEIIEERNIETIKKINMYKLYRPWVNIKYR